MRRFSVLLSVTVKYKKEKKKKMEKNYKMFHDYDIINNILRNIFQTI